MAQLVGSGWPASAFERITDSSQTSRPVRKGFNRYRSFAAEADAKSAMPRLRPILRCNDAMCHFRRSPNGRNSRELRPLQPIQMAMNSVSYCRFFNHRSAPAPTIQQQAKAKTSVNPSPAMADLGSQSGKPESRALFLIREVNRRPVATARTNATISAIFKSRFSPVNAIVAEMTL
jgi:hypothetical protein